MAWLNFSANKARYDLNSNEKMLDSFCIQAHVNNSLESSLATATLIFGTLIASSLFSTRDFLEENHLLENSHIIKTWSTTMLKKILLCATLLWGVPQVASAEQYTFGVVPQQSPMKLFKTWKPIVDYLSKETGHKVIFKTEKSIAKFESVLYAGGYDIAYMNPYHYVIAQRRQGFQAKVRAKKMIRGILVARKGQGEFSDLINDPKVRYSFPSPNAFAATLLTKFELLDKYDVNVEQQKQFQYVNSHDSVYSGIARGVGQVGGGIQRTFNNFNKSNDKNKLEVIYTTSAYPSHPIAFKPDINTELQEKLAQALLKVPKHLIDALSIKNIITTNDKEYDVIRHLEEGLEIVKRK